MRIRNSVNSIGKVADAKARAEQFTRLIGTGFSLSSVTDIARLTVKGGRMTPERERVINDILKSEGAGCDEKRRKTRHRGNEYGSERTGTM